MKIQAKGILNKNDELNKVLTSFGKETRGLQMSINKIKDELFISRRERDKSTLKHKKLVNVTTIDCNMSYIKYMVITKS